jgi:DNA gyrase subunit B
LYNAQAGTHIDGFNQGMAKLMNDYAKKFALSKDTIEQRDLKPGIIAVVNILHTAPTYSSQTKDQLSDTFAKQAINAIVKDAGMFEFDRAINDVEAIIKQAIQRANDRKKFSDLSSIKVETKETKAAVSKKLKPAKKLRGDRGVESAEIFVVEGDSAAGSLVRMRLNDSGVYQAVFPLRGKIINAMKTTPDKLFKNTEISTIVTALGCGIGAKYDENKLKYDKVIIATDADPDGSNISMLLQAFFFEYMPKLIENGHLYRVMTPLYDNRLKNGKDVLAYNDAEQDAIIEEHGDNIVETLRNKGLGEIGDEKTGIWMNNPGTRKLYQYAINDFDNAYSNMQLLMGNEIGPRRDFLMENAEFAQNLD